MMPQHDRIKLCIPSKPDYIVTARLVAGSFASRAGFNMDQIEDIKAAVGEACIMLSSGTIDAQIELIFTFDEKLMIEVAAPSANIIKQEEPRELEEISIFLLEAFMDNVDFSQHDGKNVYLLTKLLQCEGCDIGMC